LEHEEYPERIPQRPLSCHGENPGKGPIFELCALKSGHPAVIIPLDALGLGSKKGFFLGIADNFLQTMVNGPKGAADIALDYILVESIGVYADFKVIFAAFADGAFHVYSPFVPCRRNLPDTIIFGEKYNKKFA
jgi:hypothetical protein